MSYMKNQISETGALMAAMAGDGSWKWRWNRRPRPASAPCGPVDVVLALTSVATSRIQEGHLVLGHILCGLIESTLFEAPA